MSDPIIDSHAKQTVTPPTDGGASGARDASVRTDAAAPTDSSSDTSRSTSTPPRTETPSAPRTTTATPTTPRTTTPPASSTPTSSWSLELDGFVSSARLGGPNGTVFSPDFSPANEGWNYSRYSIGLGATHRWLLDPHFRIGVGGRIGYLGLSGDRHAPGRMDGGELSLHGEIGIPIIPEIEPVLRAMVTGLLATGETTAGNNFSVDGTGGPGLALRALAGVRINLGQFSVMPYFSAETGFIPNARGSASAPWVDFGGGIMASYVPGASSSPSPQICSEGGVEETPGSMGRRIQRLHTADIPTLRSENDYRRDILRVLHGGLGSRASAPELVASIRHGYEYYLEHRTDNPITNAAERARLAVEEFPDGMDPFNPTPVAETEVPDPLPTDCAELAALRDALETERDALDRQNGLLEGMAIGFLHEMGVPPQSAPSVMRAITLLELPSSNFRQGKPDPAQLTAAQTYLSTFTSQAQPTNAAEVNARARQLATNRTLQAIFPIASAEMQALARVANILLGYELPSTVQPGGSSAISATDQAAVRDILGHMPVVIEAHASSEGTDANNMALTQRRADFIRAVLVALGVPAERLTARGFGESQLLVAETNDAGRPLTGQPLQSAQNRNRRVRFAPDVARMDPATGHVRAAPTLPATAGDGGTTTPVVPGSAETSGSAGASGHGSR